MQSIAIVTGATSGVGREFVRQLDQGHGGPLNQIWLVARDATALAQVAAETATPTRVLALDLTLDSSYESLRDELDREEGLVVQWLVNCAGFGRFGGLGEIGEKANANMVRLNCLAVVECCYHALPHMVAGSRIINLSSVAALAPQPYLSVYSATKRFVLDFSRTLDHELGGSGIHVTAVCPKFMRTGFLDDPGNAEQVRRMTTIGFEPVDAVVAKALAAAIRGRATCVPSWDVKAIHVATKLLPSAWVMAGEDLLLGPASRR